MKRKLNKATLLPALFLIIFSCVTINIYFPAAAVEKAADKIVEETWGKKGTGPQESGEKPRSRIEQWMEKIAGGIGLREAWAQEADINVTTPAIRSLKESIRKRAGSIKPYMDKGAVGITNEGLLTVRSTEGLTLRKMAALARLTKAENRDRDTLYLEIAKANNFTADKVPEIRKIFASSWIDNARNGWWVQDPEGKWRQK